jgi:hypothetical protein
MFIGHFAVALERDSGFGISSVIDGFAILREPAATQRSCCGLDGADDVVAGGVGGLGRSASPAGRARLSTFALSALTRQAKKPEAES